MQDLIKNLRDDIHDAALCPELWQKIVVDIKKMCPASMVEIMLYDEMTSSVPWSFTTLEGASKEDYLDHYRHINTLWPIMKALKCGKVSDTDHFDAVRQVKNTDFYNGFMLPNDFEFIQGANIASAPSLIGACVIGYKGNINRKHTAQGRALLQTLLPDIQRSFNFSRKYANRHHGVGRVKERVDQHQDPAFMIAEDGKIEYMNEAALVAVSKRRGIKVGFDNKLRFLDIESDGFYGALLRQTFRQAQTLSSEAVRGLPAMTGEVPFYVQGEPGLNSVSIIPLGRGKIRKQPETDDIFRVYSDDTTRRVIVVLQYYQDNMIRLKPLFKLRFDLTKTESEIAFGIMKGYSHKEYEDIFGSKAITAKKHLSKIYDKTGVNEKGKLVALLHHHKRSFDLKDKFE